MLDANPPIDETPPSINDIEEAVARTRDGKAAGICDICVELLKTGDGALIFGLYAV